MLVYACQLALLAHQFAMSQLQSSALMVSSVTMGWMTLAAGWETTACQLALPVPHQPSQQAVLPQLLFSAQLRRLFVTTATMLAAGLEIIVCLVDLSVLMSAILQLHLHALQQK